MNLLHRATHRIPGVPAHTDRPAGHQGRRNPRRNHPPARVLVAWQRRVAAFFGRPPR